MKKTFEEKLKVKYHKIVEKRPYLKTSAFVVLGIILHLHNFWFTLIGGWKRYAITFFLLINILIGSSFTHPVFGNYNSFISPQTTNEIVPVGESTITLMSDEVYYDDILEDMKPSTWDAGESDIDEYDSYSLEDILAEREISENELGENSLELHLDKTDIGEILFSADDWRLILINKWHPIPDDYEYVLGTITGSMQSDARIIDDLLLMMQKAQDDGINLVIISPYRDLDHQELLFTNKINSFIRSGMSYLEAYRFASQTITVPGTSEHQVGLALDITSREYRFLNTGFAETEAGRWLADNSYEFGFILRYPLGKESITGIEFEPWHFRYVGREAAQIIKEEGLALEEFVERYVR